MVRVVSLYYYTGAVAVTVAIGSCLWHADTREQYSFIAAAFVYGFALEQAMIQLYETYTYNVTDVVLTLLDVPVHVAVAWAAILYAGWQTGLALGVSERRLPFFVALFALHIDLSMDVVAIQIPYWTWEMPGLWFGVPLNNFYGWYLVAFFFVGSALALDGAIPRPELRYPAVIVVSLASLVVAVLTWALLFAWSDVTEVATVLALIVVGLVAVLSDDMDPRPAPRSVAATPFVFHVFFLGVLLALGLHDDQPLILVVALAMLGVGILVHGYPVWYGRHRSNRTET